MRMVLVNSSVSASHLVCVAQKLTVSRICFHASIERKSSTLKISVKARTLSGQISQKVGELAT